MPYVGLMGMDIVIVITAESALTSISPFTHTYVATVLF